MAKRFTLRGPGVLLPAEAATQSGSVLHELGTNAKTWALFDPGGTIAVGWTASRGKLHLAWRERGGPRIDAAPSHKGFGTVLIDLSAVTVSRRFDPAGLTCKTSTLPYEHTGSFEWHGESGTMLNGARILVVEDEPLIAMELAQTIEEAGGTVVASARTHLEALRFAETAECDAALLDVRLRDGTAFDAAAILAARGIPLPVLHGRQRRSGRVHPVAGRSGRCKTTQSHCGSRRAVPALAE